MSGKSSQRKGADGERELAELLREHGYDIRRGGSLSFGEVPDLMGLPGIHIEVKRVERLNVGEAMDQAIRDADRFHDGAPTLFHRRNRQPWLVTMRLEDWLKLYPPEEQAGLSQILCKHRNAVQIEQNIFKAEVAQAAAALFSK